jgi:hypothetical protein
MVTPVSYSHANVPRIRAPRIEQRICSAVRNPWGLAKCIVRGFHTNAILKSIFHQPRVVNGFIFTQMQSNHSSRPTTGTRPSTSAPQATPNFKLQAALETHGSFANALAAVTSADFADKLVQVWSVFYDRCRFLDSRISPTGNLSWTEVKGVISYLHIQKLTTERCLRNLFSDLGTFFLFPTPS